MDGIQDGVAVVTGAGSGIGRETARRFAREGASVVVADVDEDGGHDTVEMIGDDGGEATFVRTDVSDQGEVDRMVQTALDEYGGLDFAHNNAGIEGDNAPLADDTEENWDAVIDVNLKGVWRCMQAEIPAMLERGGGRIVNTASISGQTGSGGAPYVASKHGVIGLTRKAAVDYSGENIRVNAVCPGIIQTPMIDRAQEDSAELLEQMTAATPAGRLGQPEEIASAVVWLCSDGASYVMGHPFTIDGALTVQ
ncbi:glucose 1-dehydrogenase [Salinirubellus salinus]|jgi:NAD(P)-dependent dehydrogenase (short-subunit alcohol dehydrogenase family)|uniref:Glucose 1-dehydrogenase n=1 Tax=Salinirubellus salinus TaxID=1364945 RepID=A0A9E7R0P3_9EURY|nr:glucose 1-dehydrogenase [Salinirubellus salinus]UWM53504.1 glucose 1-dehydrogenase [Salinirubellus salinus]